MASSKRPRKMLFTIIERIHEITTKMILFGVVKSFSSIEWKTRSATRVVSNMMKVLPMVTRNDATVVAK